MLKYIDTYSFGAKDPNGLSLIKENDYIYNAFSYAVKSAMSDLTSYWSTSDAQKVITEETFEYIWDNFLEHRGTMIDMALSKASESGHYTRVNSVSKEFCENFLEDLYDSFPIDDNLENNKLRSRLASVVDVEFDYLSELHKLSLTEDSRDVYNVWKASAMRSSKNEELFDYLWGKVKRERGATDQKQEILRAALDRGSLSDWLIKKIAKSSPKRLKRVVVSDIGDKIRQNNRALRSYETRNSETPSPEIQDRIDELKEILVTLENRAMLFVGCDDYSVVESLIDCLSRDNLPWLMPSAANHYWLSTRISRIIESSE